MLRVGSRGDQVRQVQKWLGMQADGIFGRQTQTAVKAYQQRHGLSADGLVGSVTLSHMRRTLGSDTIPGNGSGNGSGGSDAVPPIPEYGVPLYPDGKIALGHLDPSTPAADFPDNASLELRDPDAALDPAKLNREFEVKNVSYCYNPFIKNDLKTADNEPLIAAYTAGSDMLKSKTIIPLRQFIAGGAQSQGPAVAALLAPLIAALPEQSVVERPTHLFNISGESSARIIYFGGNAWHNEIDAVTEAMGLQNMRLMKEWVHFADIPLNETAQGGRLEDVLGNKYTIGGGSHLGALSLGWRDGEPIAIKSDWGDFADPSDKFPHYGLHLFAIDYQAGVQDPVPTETLATYKQNADMWDCFAAMVSPFHTDHTDHDFASREKYNSLEASDQETLKAFTEELAKLDKNSFDRAYAGFYCAEAHYIIANLGPQEGTLLKKSKFGNTRVGEFIKRFQAAPEYRGKPEEWKRKHPEHGWKHLTKGSLFRSAPLRRNTHSFFHNTTKQTGVYLDWIPEDVKGWQSYKPLNEDGLVANPATVASIAWAVCRLYMPREAIADAIVKEVTNAYTAGGANVKRAVLVLTQNADPTQAAGKRNLATFASKVATQSLAAILSQPDTKNAILSQAAIEEISDPNERQQIERLYAEFIATVARSVLSNQEQLDSDLRALDKRVASMRVTRRTVNGKGQPSGNIRNSLMNYVPPGMWAFWAQHPFMSRSTCVRYVATALHKNLSK